MPARCSYSPSRLPIFGTRDNNGPNQPQDKADDADGDDGKKYFHCWNSSRIDRFCVTSSFAVASAWAFITMALLLKFDTVNSLVLGRKIMSGVPDTTPSSSTNGSPSIAI